jgi:hypothetical protein
MNKIFEGIKLRTREEQEEFFRLCDEIGIYTDRDIANFKKEVECTDDNFLQALRDYRAELGPDFKIADPDYERQLAMSEDFDIDDLVEALMPYLGTTFMVDVRLGLDPHNEVTLIMHKDGNEVKIPFEFGEQY